MILRDIYKVFYQSLDSYYVVVVSTKLENPFMPPQLIEDTIHILTTLSKGSPITPAIINKVRRIVEVSAVEVSVVEVSVVEVGVVEVSFVEVSFVEVSVLKSEGRNESVAVKVLK